MRVSFNTRSGASYRQFLAIRRLPIYHFAGEDAVIPDEYADRIGAAPIVPDALQYDIADRRRFYGCELKPEYYQQARKNLTAAASTVEHIGTRSLFD